MPVSPIPRGVYPSVTALDPMALRARGITLVLAGVAISSILSAAIDAVSILFPEAALGANAVGMSTACEAIAARHMGLEVCGISCVTNLAAGLSGEPLTHEEVQQTADRAAQRFQGLVWELLSTIEV